MERVTGQRATLPDGTLITHTTEGGQAWVRVERSVPTVLHGHNRVASPVPDVQSWVRTVYQQIRQFAAWSEGPEEMRVARLDTVRDFQGVHTPGRLLDALSRLPVARAPINKRWAEPTRGDAQSLLRGVPDRWRCTAYDKGAELAARSRKEQHPARANLLHREANHALGQLRVEVSARRNHLTTRGIDTVSDLTTERVDRVHRELFDRAGFGTAVRGVSAIDEAARAMAADSRDQGRLLAVMGWLLLSAHGLPTPVGETTRREYRKIAKRYGLSPADFATLGSTIGVVLDYDLGQLVPA